jgi:hypothetical protein
MTPSLYLVIRSRKLLGAVYAADLREAQAKAYTKFGAGCFVEIEATHEDLLREQYHGT